MTPTVKRPPNLYRKSRSRNGNLAAAEFFGERLAAAGVFAHAGSRAARVTTFQYGKICRARAQAQSGTEIKQGDLMMMDGGMMLGMGFIWLLVMALLVLAVVALVKYLRT